MDAAHHCQFAPAVADCLNRAVDADQRGGARRIDRFRRAAQVEQEGHAVGQQRLGVAEHRLGDGFSSVTHDLRVVIQLAADEDPNRSSRE